MKRIVTALGLAILAWAATRFALAWLLDTQACAVGWLPGWWPSWAAFCADDLGVRAARAVQIADWHRALPLMVGAAVFALAAWPWRFSARRRR